MADIGLVGLGVMGANLALNMAEKGYSVAVFNRTAEKTDAFVANAGSLAERLTPCRTLTELAEAVEPPRPVVIMVKAGAPVDAVIEQLKPLLEPGDIIIAHCRAERLLGDDFRQNDMFVRVRHFQTVGIKT